MAQAFTTTTKKDYKWKEQKKRHLLIPHDGFAEQVPESDMWYVPKELEVEHAEEQVKSMYRKRYFSTYQNDYNRELMREFGILPQLSETKESEMFEYFQNLFSWPKKAKILPPLPSSRRLLGYLRPGRLYTPLTSYQFYYGRVAYNVLKEISDSEAKKVKELEKSLAGILKPESAKINIEKDKGSKQIEATEGFKLKTTWDSTKREMTCSCKRCK